MESSQDKKITIVTCLIASLLLHAALFGGYGAYVTFFKPEQLSEPEIKVKKKSPQAEETIVVQFNPTVSVLDKVPVIPESVDDLPPDLKHELSEKELEELEKKIEENKPNAVVLLPSRFERTTAAQQSAITTPETELYGARNTREQSDTTPDANAPNRPAVGGVENPNRAEIIDSRFQDGEVADEGGGDAEPSGGDIGENDVIESAEQFLAKLNKVTDDAPTPEELADSIEEQLKKDLSEAPNTEVVKETKEPDLAETIEIGNRIEKNEEEERLKEQQEKEKRLAEASQIKEKNLIEQIKERRGSIDHSRDPFAKAAGLTSEVERNKIKGSVTERGATASRNVKKTELGKYKSIVLRAVEKQWNKEAKNKGGLLQPGQITMSFIVNTRGNILNVKTVDKNAGNGYNLNIALNGIKKAVIPSMPSKLKSELQGNPIEIFVTFNVAF